MKKIIIPTFLALLIFAAAAAFYYNSLYQRLDSGESLVLTGGEMCEEGTAVEADIRSGKTADIDCDDVAEEGTAVLATAENVKLGVDNAWAGTGTLAPSGIAGASDCKSSKTFYSGDTWVQKTGTAQCVQTSLPSGDIICSENSICGVSGTATCGGGSGNPCDLPKTGQATSYGTSQTCGDGGTGNCDDGYYEKGCGMSFTDNTDGTITDNCTGLMWEQDGSTSGLNWHLNWQQAIDECETLSLGPEGSEYTDWRLPNVKELQSIVDYGTYSPAIDALFTNTASDLYWSSITASVHTGYAWSVSFNLGTVFNSNKTYNYYARCVRGQ